MTTEEILSMFNDSGALLEGHFELTSGLHSAQYFQCAKVLQYPKRAERLCGEIARHFLEKWVDVVIAPAIGGIVVAQEVGRQLNVRSMFTERKDGTMLLRRGFEIRSGENVLVCEDVVTTGGSVKEVVGIVEQCGGKVVGVGAIVDRSGGNSGLSHLYATMPMDVVTYSPDQCPLCAKGISVVKPGSRKNA